MCKLWSPLYHPRGHHLHLELFLELSWYLLGHFPTIFQPNNLLICTFSRTRTAVHRPMPGSWLESSCASTPTHIGLLVFFRIASWMLSPSGLASHVFSITIFNLSFCIIKLSFGISHSGNHEPGDFFVHSSFLCWGISWPLVLTNWKLKLPSPVEITAFVHVFKGMLKFSAWSIVSSFASNLFYPSKVTTLSMFLSSGTWPRQGQIEDLSYSWFSWFKGSHQETRNLFGKRLIWGQLPRTHVEDSVAIWNHGNNKRAFCSEETSKSLLAMWTVFFI